MNRDHEYLLDAIQACTLILEFTQGYDQKQFERDRKTQSSVLYQIAILSEAVNRLSSNYQTANPNIPIAPIRGMRNRIIHEYKETDLKILWDVIEIDIPDLLAQLRNSRLPEP
jgi:uncharacterized protein with HEPN domain